VRQVRSCSASSQGEEGMKDYDRLLASALFRKEGLELLKSQLMRLGNDEKYSNILNKTNGMLKDLESIIKELKAMDD
jgi:hypothetical protein